MHVSEDNEWLFMSNELGYIKQFNHRTHKFEKSWGQVMGGQINRIIGMYGMLYVSDSKSEYSNGPVGNVRVFNMKDGKMIKDVEALIPAGILDMILIPGNGPPGWKDRLILAGADRVVYEFDGYHQRELVTWPERWSGDITAIVM